MILTITTLMRSLAPFKEIIAIIAIGLALFVGLRVYINNQVDKELLAFEKKQQEVLLEIREMNDQLEKKFSERTGQVFKEIEEIRKESEDAIQRFNNEDGSSDPSGINGKFLRD